MSHWKTRVDQGMLRKNLFAWVTLYSLIILYMLTNIHQDLTGKQECYIMRQWQLFFQRKSMLCFSGCESAVYDFIYVLYNCLFSDYSVLSNFTWNLFEDSGWYRVNFTFTETAVEQFDLQWGRGWLLRL